jgi:hypothetical protein
LTRSSSSATAERSSKLFLSVILKHSIHTSALRIYRGKKLINFEKFKEKNIISAEPIAGV